MNDAEIVAAFNAGAWDGLIVHYAVSVDLWLMRRYADALDDHARLSVAHDAWMRVVAAQRRGVRWDVAAQAGAYLWRALGHAALDWLRGEPPAAPSLDALPGWADAQAHRRPGPDAPLDAVSDMELRALRSFVAADPLDVQAIWLLAEGHPFAEVQRRVDGAKWRAERVRRWLRAEYPEIAAQRRVKKGHSRRLSAAAD